MENIKLTVNNYKDVDIIKIWIESDGIFIHTTGRSGVFLFPISGHNKCVKFIADIFKIYKLNKKNETIYKLGAIVFTTGIYS